MPRYMAKRSELRRLCQQVNIMRIYSITAVGLALALMGSPANACLTFCLQHEKNIVYGRNFDWKVDTGAVFINRRNVRKKAIVFPPEKAVSWVSKYGSVTFNQFSKEVPIGGMNDEGLVIESLVSKAKHPRANKSKAINELQWIQYHLDTCRTVDEVVQSARSIRISRYAVDLHYFVGDHSGQSAVIEFIGGKMVHKSAGSLPIKVLANTNYDHALKTMVPQKGLDNSAKSRKASRFGRAARMIEKYNGRKKPVEYAFDILDEVSQGDSTKWQVVYDIPNRRIFFRTLRKHKTKMIELSHFHFEHAKESLILDVNTNGEGSMQEQFKEYTEEFNDGLIKQCLREFKKAGIMQHIKAEHIEHIRKVVASCKHGHQGHRYRTSASERACQTQNAIPEKLLGH